MKRLMVLGSSVVLMVLMGTMLLVLHGRAGASPGFDLMGVPEGDTQARLQVRTEGRQIAAEVDGGDAAALFRRFTPQMAAQVPEASLSRLLTSVLAQGRPGPCAGDSVRVIPGGDHVYVADAPWYGQTLRLSVVFDAQDAVAGMTIQPRLALPPDPHAGYRTRTALRLPFAGTWWVFWGGNAEADNYHVLAPDQRHAYDFCAWEGGETHTGDGSKNADYYDWGRPILAPADAVVIEATDGIPDNTPGVMDAGQPAGNHVVLSFGGGEYALLAHMQCHSVRVHRGERVRVGQPLGLCGNSGNSSEPHLHMHLQDRPQLFHGAHGLPLAFVHYTADGHPVARGEPTQGQFIQTAPAPQRVQ